MGETRQGGQQGKGGAGLSSTAPRVGEAALGGSQWGCSLEVTWSVPWAMSRERGPRFKLYVIVILSLSRVRLLATPWTAARQASLSITNFWSLLKLMSIELVMPSNYLILCHLLLPPSIFPSIRVFSNESVLCIKWPEYWSSSFSISPSNEYLGLISFRID